jgi:hypothetical protein
MTVGSTKFRVFFVADMKRRPTYYIWSTVKEDIPTQYRAAQLLVSRDLLTYCNAVIVAVCHSEDPG